MSTAVTGTLTQKENNTELSGLRSIATPSSTGLKSTTMSTSELSSLMRISERGANPELNKTINLALVKLESLSETQRYQVLKVASDLVQTCSAADLLDDRGNMLSPNSSLSARKDAIAQSLARALVGIDSNRDIGNVFSELSSLLNDKSCADSPKDLLIQRGKVAFHLMYEIGADDQARVSQKNDVTCVLTVANKDLARERPADYIRAIRQWTLDGVADISSSEGGSVRVKYTPGALSSDRLKERTIGCAIFQNTIANYYGIIETGMLPYTAEKFYDDVLGGVKLLTPTTEVCSNTTSADEIMSAATGRDWVGVSMKWATEGQTHNNHFLRLKSTVEIDGKKYVKLENPWSSEDNVHLPASVLATSKLLGGVGNELLMEESEFKKRIYFVLIKTGAEDRGETAGLNKDNTTITQFPDSIIFDSFLKMVESLKIKSTNHETVEERDAKARGATIKHSKAVDLNFGQGSSN